MVKVECCNGQNFFPSSCPIGSASTVYFADGSKVKVYLSSTTTTSDLLDMDLMKEHLTSSAAYVWLVDSLGNGKGGTVRGGQWSRLHVMLLWLVWYRHDSGP